MNKMNQTCLMLVTSQLIWGCTIKPLSRSEGSIVLGSKETNLYMELLSADSKDTNGDGVEYDKAYKAHDDVLADKPGDTGNVSDGALTTAVVLITVGDSKTGRDIPPPLSIEEARERLTKTNEFYMEESVNSFGLKGHDQTPQIQGKKSAVPGTHADYYEVYAANTLASSICGSQTPAVAEVSDEYGVDLEAEYDLVIAVQAACKCAGAALASQELVVLNGNAFKSLPHEFGHWLGLGHAESFKSCTLNPGDSAVDACSDIGHDTNSTMAWGSVQDSGKPGFESMASFSVADKSILGFPKSVQLYENDQTQYVLQGHEGKGVTALQFEDPSGLVVGLEQVSYRANNRSLEVHYSPLSFDPGFLNGVQGADLTQGESYFDGQRTITALGLGETKEEYRVAITPGMTLPGCTNFKPFIEVKNEAVGGTQHFRRLEVEITSGDYDCEDKVYSIVVDAPAGWFTIAPQSIQLSSAESKTVEILVQPLEIGLTSAISKNIELQVGSRVAGIPFEVVPGNTMCNPDDINNGNGTCTAHLKANDDDAYFGVFGKDSYQDVTSSESSKMTGSSTAYSGSNLTINAGTSSNGFYGYRAMMSFPTEGIPETAEVVEASLSVFTLMKKEYYHDAQSYIAVAQATPSDPSHITSADYGNIGHDSAMSREDAFTSINLLDLLVYGRTDLPLNEDGLDWLNMSGSTYFGIVSGFDFEKVDDSKLEISNSIATSVGNSHIWLASSQNEGKEPILKIVYRP